MALYIQTQHRASLNQDHEKQRLSCHPTTTERALRLGECGCLLLDSMPLDPGTKALCLSTYGMSRGESYHRTWE